MSVRIITASAGSGKTYRLSELLDEAIGTGSARPEGIVATTFTKQAAAELIERARGRLLSGGHGRAAHKLLAARIGTVNSVCGTFVTDFAFELGLSPSLQVLDESAADVELRRALSSVVTPEAADTFERLKRRMDQNAEWTFEVRRVIEAARANGLGSDALRACARRSIDELDRCLADPEPDGTVIEKALQAAIETALAEGAADGDETKGTQKYLTLLRSSLRSLQQKRLRWGEWAKLCKAEPTKKSLPLALPIQEAARRHAVHPGLREDMHQYIGHLFEAAADGLDAYQAHKRDQGVLDFVDQETLALQLLQRDEVRVELAGQIDLVLVDEFQDTSPLQLAIFLQLATLARESVWVGDPKQAIFGFRGTDPKLMDAAIESLASPAHDARLVDQAVAALGKKQELETLSTSFRSRPELVAITSDIFAPAFLTQGMPEKRTRLRAALQEEPAGLGCTVEHWPLVVDGRSNKEKRAACAASGVADLLRRGEHVRDRASGQARPLRPSDIAVLCRTNSECQEVAQALANRGVAAVLPQMRLLDTLEAAAAVAALRLFVDARDALAAATLARAFSYPDAAEAFVAGALANPGVQAFADDPAVKGVLAARELHRSSGVLHAFDAALEALDLRTRVAEWGDSEQRRANLDALRSHAQSYVDQACSSGGALTLVGLLDAFDDMADDFGFYGARSDRQAVVGRDNAVTVSTWHRSKGLEWPIAILFGLEGSRKPYAYGVHVATDRTEFDVDDPLGGRWVRYWPNPYTTSNSGGPVRDAFEASAAFDDVLARARSEALRVLYVGWTRARDRLILAVQPGKLADGIVGTLMDIDPALLHEPEGTEAGIARCTWAERSVDVPIVPQEASEPSPRTPVAGQVLVARGEVAHPPARALPSKAEPVPCKIGQVVELGPRLAIGNADMEMVGHAVHGFLASDPRGAEVSDRIALAEGLLQRYGVAGALQPSDVVAAADCLWTWIDATWPGAILRHEWPISYRDAQGTVWTGTADLLIETSEGIQIVDHKTFPGARDAALERANSYSGQLATYRNMLTAAGHRPSGAWIHLPVLGIMAPVADPTG